MGVRCTLDGHASGRQWLLRSVCDHLPDEELDLGLLTPAVLYFQR